MKDFKQGEYVTRISYEVVFDDGCNNGYVFPCDENGKFVNAYNNPNAEDNYHWCLEHPDKFVRYNKVIKRESRWKEPNSGICYCGNRIELFNDYLGACECPHCGQWWNLFGQALNNPETWRSGDDW